ncbi:aldo/keto reductase [Candidatus Stoquefichus massiliensis]|uniref:aldo/keto reductase n=1 Tax=Candidatus Stoquefichus massiliensis TaxID=1470350 RepID=UPI00048157FE|nr:aldo/keto reductase [Candidatus Stoquefichus massiliensis]
MKYRKLGRTNINVSEVSIGCEGLIDKSDEQVQHFVDKARNMGVNFIDFYSSNPQARSAFGKAIKDHRDDWVIEGHLCSVWKNDQYLRTRKIDEVKAGFEDLLERLKTDYVDVGMIHYVDSQEDFDEVFTGEVIAYALELKKQGKIKHIGLSSHNPMIARKAIETGLIDVLLFSINPCYDMLPASENVDDLWADENYEKPLTNIDSDRQALYELCERENVAITVMKAFGGGDLLDAQLSPFGVSMTPLQCIHYCLTRPGVVSVMAGAHTIEELQLSTFYSDATNEEKDYAPILAHVPKHSFIGNCVYCGHCAPCVKGIDVASVNKFTDLCIAQGMIPETVREHYKLLAHHASECIACGSCVHNCPFQVDIISKMKKAVEIFGY